MKDIFVQIALLFFCAISVHGQTLFTPEDYFFINTNYPLINPAYTARDYAHEFSVNYSGFSGVKKIINSTQVHASILLNDQQRTRLGFQIRNHSEGKFIQSNDFVVLFNYRLINSQRHKLTVGGVVGAINLRIISNGTTRSGSDWAPSATVGGVYELDDTWRFGVSVINLIRNELIPIGQVTNPQRKMIASLDKEFKISPNQFIQPTVITGVNNSRSYVSTLIQYRYASLLSVHIGYRTVGEVLWGVGVEKVRIAKGDFKVFFGSNLPFSGSPIQSSRYEWLLAYYLK